jgi:uncharacterized coiled-coil DUF342 family protein
MSITVTNEMMERYRKIAAILNDSSADCLGALDVIRIGELERELAAMTKERDELRAHADALARALEDMGFSWVPSLEAYRASQQAKP